MFATIQRDQLITTLLDHVIKEMAKRTKHFNTTYHNTVEHNMLHTFGHPVAMSCAMLEGARAAL